MDLTRLDEDIQVAFYGALFAMASADGRPHETEHRLIRNYLVASGLGETVTREIEELAFAPPPFEGCLEALETTGPETRRYVYQVLVGVACADHEEHPDEMRALDRARVALGIADEEAHQVLDRARAALDQVRELTGNVPAASVERDCAHAPAPRGSQLGLSPLGTLLSTPVIAAFRMGGLTARAILTGLMQLGSLIDGGIRSGLGLVLSYDPGGEGTVASIDSALEHGALKDPRMASLAREIRDLHRDWYGRSHDRHILAEIEGLTDRFGQILRKDVVEPALLDTFEGELGRLRSLLVTLEA